jgi:hypothetical protein
MTACPALAARRADYESHGKVYDMNWISRVLVCTLVLAGVAGEAAAEAPGDSIKAAGFLGGLVVALDGNDPGLLSSLKKQGVSIVLGLEQDAARVPELRKQVQAAGKKLSELKLQSEPVFDGMIAANGRLFMSTRDGRVICLGAKP